MQQNKLTKYVNAELSKDDANAFKASVMNLCGWNKAKYYRVLNNPALASKLEREAIAKLAGKPETELFELVTP